MMICQLNYMPSNTVLAVLVPERLISGNNMKEV